MDRLRQVFDRILECDGFGIIIAFTHKKAVYVEYGGKEGVIYRTYLSGDTPNYCAIIRTSHWSAGDAHINRGRVCGIISYGEPDIMSLVKENFLNFSEIIHNNLKQCLNT